MGGGPAGLAAAIAARQQGLRVALADPMRPPIDKACGEGLMPDCLEELSRLGISLAGRVQAAFRGIRFADMRTSVAAEFPRGLGIGIRRTLLHTALIERAEQLGVELFWGARLGELRTGAVLVDDRVVRCKWIVGADGQNSQVRRWARLHPGVELERRMALRQHFFMSQPPEFVEIHWGKNLQGYVTPMAPGEVCVALISKRKLGTFQHELEGLPGLADRLRNARTASSVRGAVTISRRLHRVSTDRVALAGEASGSVDAITGEGLALSFRHALSLARALTANNLSIYESEHRQMQRLPQFMGRAMLLLDKNSMVRSRVLRAFEARPRLFARMLSVHVGELPILRFGFSAAANLAWQMLTA